MTTTTASTSSSSSSVRYQSSLMAGLSWEDGVLRNLGGQAERLASQSCTSWEGWVGALLRSSAYRLHCKDCVSAAPSASTGRGRDPR